MNREAVLELEAQVGVLTRRLRRVVAERAAALDPSLSSVGYVVLEHLRRHGPSRQSEIVAALSSEKGAVSRAVRELAGLGFVDCVPDPEDGRAQQVAISGFGTQRLDEVVEARRAAYAEKLKDWTTDEILSLAADLARYNASLDARD